MLPKAAKCLTVSVIYLQPYQKYLQFPRFSDKFEFLVQSKMAGIRLCVRLRVKSEPRKTKKTTNQRANGRHENL